MYDVALTAAMAFAVFGIIGLVMVISAAVAAFIIYRAWTSTPLEDWRTKRLIRRVSRREKMIADHEPREGTLTASIRSVSAKEAEAGRAALTGLGARARVVPIADSRSVADRSETSRAPWRAAHPAPAPEERSTFTDGPEPRRPVTHDELRSEWFARAQNKDAVHMLAPEVAERAGIGASTARRWIAGWRKELAAQGDDGSDVLSGE